MNIKPTLVQPQQPLDVRSLRVALDARSVRLGSYKGVPCAPIMLSLNGIVIDMESKLKLLGVT